MTRTLVGKWSTIAAAGILAVAALGTAAVEATADATSATKERWDAAVVVNGVEIPFLFEISRDGATVTGSFFNGERRIDSTAGSFENGILDLRFDQYAARLEATAIDGGLTGEYRRGTRTPYPFTARRASDVVATAVDAPSIDGTWIVGAKSNKGETAWRFIVKQTGAAVSATILRVDGDTGTLSGSYRDGRFVLSHFSGARPLLLEVTPGPDGTLTLRQNPKTELVAVRAETDRAREIGEPTDPALHTRVKDPSEPFRFSFPDLTGNIVSSDDAQFRGKVVLINISGSWCPNCHDEAPFLAALHRKYQSAGLEVVTLSFEEADQLSNPTRLRAFNQQYGIAYTVLLAGEPDHVEAKVPQAVNLNAFPTTFILGRDGRVRAVHTGFPSPGSGEFYSKAEHDVTEQIERLLAERAPGTF